MLLAVSFFYLSCQEKLGKVCVVMETIEKRQERTDATAIKLPLIQNEQSLAARLKELQRIVVLERISYNEMPPRVDYNLTDRGQ